MTRKYFFLIVISLLVLLSCNHEKDKLEEVLAEQRSKFQVERDSLSKVIIYLKKQISDYHQNSKRSNSRGAKRFRIVEEENIGIAEVIDFKIVREIPRAIIDSLQKEYPNFYIPKANRFKANGAGDFNPDESPFYILGDFNNDNITDYAFCIESYGSNYYSLRSLEQRIVVLSSKKFSDKAKYEFFEFHVVSGGNIVFAMPGALVKLSPQKEYYLYDEKLELKGDKILYISHGTQVGALLEWNGNEYIRNYLWDTL